ncbi:MAG: hypothetical protein ACKO3K_05565 [Cuspidothrix sp.]
MLPEFYKTHLKDKLTLAEYMLLKIMIILLQSIKKVSLEALATALPIPIKFESRKRKIQRFLSLPNLTIKALLVEVIANYCQQLSNSTRENNAIVLTVAHGNGCWIAQRYQLPLVTIFHDWFPDLPSLHKPCCDLLAKRLQKLYQQSNLALCVSEGMKNALGSHSNSKALYPIPALLAKKITKQHQVKNDQQISSRLKVVYSGNLYEYRPILAQLLEVTKSHPQIQVQVRGSRPNWPADFRSEMRDRQLWLDFAPREELNDWSASADVFLVVMSFDPALRKRMETSFPSKLPEYAQFGKPIVIWGPEYCSAIRWGREGDRAICVTDENPTILVSALERLKDSPQQLEYYRQQAKIASQTEFNPSIIQNQFLDHIQDILLK